MKLFTFTRKKVIASTLGMFIVSCTVLGLDAATPDMLLIITLMVGMFGFVLDLSSRMSRVEQKLDDHILNAEPKKKRK